MRLHNRLERLEEQAKAQALEQALPVLAHAFDDFSTAELTDLVATYDPATKSQRPPETWTPEQAAAVEKYQQGRDVEAIANAIRAVEWACNLEHEDELGGAIFALLDARGLTA